MSGSFPRVHREDDPPTAIRAPDRTVALPVDCDASLCLGREEEQEVILTQTAFPPSAQVAISWRPKGRHSWSEYSGDCNQNLFTELDTKVRFSRSLTHFLRRMGAQVFGDSKSCDTVAQNNRM
jgi:hypothetical protein